MIKKHSQQLIALSRIILIRYLILYACEDHGIYYKFYLKKLKNNTTTHLSYTNLKTTLYLDMSNDPNEKTTKYETTIEAVFCRYLGNFQLKVFISYFNYYKPIVSFLE